MRRAVVVGGSGFIGGEVVSALLAAGDEVVVFDRSVSQGRVDARFGRHAARAVRGDIGDPEALRAAFARADEVYHLAGALGTSELDAQLRHAVEANVIGAVNVFEAAARAGVTTVFLASKPNVWLNAYSITKHAAEQLAQLVAERDGVRVCALRFFNAYGPRQSLRPVRKIVPTFAAQALRGQPLGVFGDGEQTVDMILAADAGRLAVELVRSGHAGPPIDCGRGVAMTVNEVAAAVNAYLGNRAGVTHLPMRPGETPGTRLVADVAPLRAAVGEPRFAPWEESLAATLDWYARLDPREIDAAVAEHAANAA
jgi:UDP-glucose 4-epimerase